MSHDLGPILDALHALAKDTPRSAAERVLAAEVQIKAWLAQTKDLGERQRMLRDLDAKIASEKVDDFSTMLCANIAQQLNAMSIQE